MTPEDYQLARELFEEICDAPAVAQQAAIQSKCNDKPAVRRLVEALLKKDACNSLALSPLTPSVAAVSPTQIFATPQPPEKIGPFRIIRESGHGGMGTVYEAEQESPRRRVALKVIRPGANSNELLARFQREADSLARMQHAGIAQIFESGVTQQRAGNLPYFAMEFIDGETLTQYAQHHELSIRARLELMIKVCDAVHYAHQRCIIHRDLKPDNILVSTEGTGLSGSALGQPKILDFGIARATDADVQMTMQTHVGQLVGTLQYMSPEQAAGDPELIDTRSDVYSLGVILFELLSGQLPYELHQHSIAQSLSIIHDTTPGKLTLVDQAYAGELETIVHKCLEKEPNQRYQSAADLAEDLQRLIRNEPITARPPSKVYQFRKFARRNRTLVGGVVATFLTLAVGATVASILAVRAEHLAAESSAQAYRASILAADSLAETDPHAALTQLRMVASKKPGWEWRYLNHRLTNNAAEFDLSGPIAGLPAVPEGSLFAMRTDGAVLRWEIDRVGSHTFVADLSVDVESVAFSPNAQRVAVVASDGSIRAHDLVVGAAIEVPTFPSANSVAITWGHDGEKIIAATREHIGVWTTAAGWKMNKFDPPLDPGYEFKSLAVIPDSNRAVGLAVLTGTGGATGQLTLLDVTTGLVLAQRTDPEVVHAMALSPDGRKLAIGCIYRSVRILAADDLSNLARPGAHQGAVLSVAFSQDGSKLCTTGDDNTIRIWDLNGSRQPKVLRTESHVAAIFSHDSSKLLYVSSLHATAGNALHGPFNQRFGESIRIVDANDGACKVLGDHQGYVYDIAYSKDSNQLVSFIWKPDNFLRLWNTRTGLSSRDLAKDYPFSNSVGLPTPGPDGTWIVPVHGGLEQRDSRSGATKNRQTMATTALEHQQSSLTTIPTPAVSEQDDLHIWRTEYSAANDDGFVLRAHRNGNLVSEISDSENSDFASHPSPIPMFLGDAPAHPDDLLNPFRGVLAELIIINGRLLDTDAAAMDQYLASRLDTGSSAFPDVGDAHVVAHFIADKSSVKLDDDGNVTAWTAANDPSVVLKIPNDTTGRLRLTVEPNGLQVLDFLEFGDRLEGTLPNSSCETNTTVILLGRYQKVFDSPAIAYSIGLRGYLNPDYQRALLSLTGDLAGYRISNSAAFSPDGSLLAVVEKGIAFVDAVIDARSAPSVTWRGRIRGDFHCLAFHPNGRELAAGSESGTIGIFDVSTREKVAELKGHRGIVYGVAYSPDGSRLASGGNDTTVRIWDTSRNEQLLELRGHEQYVKAVLFSPDGSQLASASGDGTVRLWDAPLTKQSQDQ